MINHPTIVPLVIHFGFAVSYFGDGSVAGGPNIGPPVTKIPQNVTDVSLFGPPATLGPPQILWTS